MRKFLLSLVFFLLFFQFPAFAQTVQISGFDYSNPVKESKTDPNTGITTIELLPFTAVFIDPETFPQGYTFEAAKGNWDSMKKLVPDDQSPISSYALTFYDSLGKQIKPSKPLRIQSFNNYAGTNTFFYPLFNDGSLDNEKTAFWSGNIKVTAQLPIDDPAFIVAADANIPRDDPTLDPANYGDPVSSSATGKPANKRDTSSILVLIGIMLSIAVIAAFVAKKRQK